MVSDPSEESLLSNAPGVNRKEVGRGYEIWVGILGAEDLLRSRIRFRICSGRGWLGFLGCRRYVRWRRIGARTNGC
jgi:hypothetical protein